MNDYTTDWTGCGDCDCSFPCHNGESRCIRLQPKPKLELQFKRPDNMQLYGIQFLDDVKKPQFLYTYANSDIHLLTIIDDFKQGPITIFNLNKAYGYNN